MLRGSTRRKKGGIFREKWCDEWWNMSKNVGYSQSTIPHLPPTTIGLLRTAERGHLVPVETVFCLTKYGPTPIINKKDTQIKPKMHQKKNIISGQYHKRVDVYEG